MKLSDTSNLIHSTLYFFSDIIHSTLYFFSDIILRSFEQILKYLGQN